MILLRQYLLSSDGHHLSPASPPIFSLVYFFYPSNCKCWAFTGPLSVSILFTYPTVQQSQSLSRRSSSIRGKLMKTTLCGNNFPNSNAIN